MGNGDEAVAATGAAVARGPGQRAGSPRAGTVVMAMLAALEADGIPCAYLRNYEGLPGEVGHDVDLLVGRGMRRRALERIRAAARGAGWGLLRVAEFGPLAVFFVDEAGEACLHIDLFDRVERHWLEFGNAAGILGRRVFNGTVHHPGAGDEVFLNVCTRLIYHGIVRDKHRQQAAAMCAAGRGEELRTAFADHLGARAGGRLAAAVEAGDWARVEASGKILRRAAWRRWGLGAPWRAAAGFGRYLCRTARRLWQPPGTFVALEGADGVGKSTVLAAVVDLLEEANGLTGTLRFHWKPCRRSVFDAAQEAAPPAHDPRGKPVRSVAASCLFLAYHWLGFWLGWWRRVYPALIRSVPVVADRYADDLFLDPRRFRLNLPDWLLRLAVATVPRPGLTLCLVAEPDVVARRKAELPAAEIARYQERWRDLARRWPVRRREVDAGAGPAEVVAAVRRTIVEWLRNQAGD